MSPSSRREFLSDSFFLAALTAASVAIPSQAMARTSKGKPSADKLRIGVIGLNGRGKAHVDGYLSNPNAEVVAICDVDLRTAEKSAAAVATKTGKKPKVYQDLRKLYEDKEVDAVSAALPIHPRRGFCKLHTRSTTRDIDGRRSIVDTLGLLMPRSTSRNRGASLADMQDLPSVPLC